MSIEIRMTALEVALNKLAAQVEELNKRPIITYKEEMEDAYKIHPDYFPKCFELDGVDPLAIPVKVLAEESDGLGKTMWIFDSWEDFRRSEIWAYRWCGPMACRMNGNPCLRYESQRFCDYISR